MKNLFLIIIIVLLVVLFGTWPLTILGKVFEWFSNALLWLAETLNFFKWNGLL